VGVSKFLQLGLLLLWSPETLRANLWWRWGLKQSCSPHWDIFNGMLQATCTQGNWGDSWLLMVRSQISNLTIDPSFGHNLCFRCPNGSCKPISDIYVSRAFQWYNEFLNPLGFDPCNFSLKIRDSTRTPPPKVGVALGVWGFISSHFPTLPVTWDVTPKLPSWPTPLQVLALVVSPRLGLQQVHSHMKENMLIITTLKAFPATLSVGQNMDFFFNANFL
jgi:hypothetical protein